MIRRGIAGTLAAALITLGIWAAVLTYHAWIPCDGDDRVPACLATMDSPPHAEALAAFWGIALVLALAAALVARTRSPRVFGLLAAILVLLMSPWVEYIVMLVIAGGHHDVPPGAGYPMSLTFTVAGILVGTGVLLDARRNRHSDQQPAPMLLRIPQAPR
jgi:hypothetical protein